MNVKIDKEKFIYLLIFLNPFFEIIYSLLSRLEIGIPINQLSRMIVFISFFLLVAKEKKIFCKVLIIFSIFVVIYGLQIMLDIANFSFSDITFLVKLIYATTLPFIFESFIKTRIVSIEKFIRAIISSTFIIIFSVCISPFGFGFEGWKNNSYRTGYVGWFRFGNYLTATLLVSLCFLLCSNNIKKRYCWIFFTALSLVLIGNKAGLAGLACFLVVLFFDFLKRLKNGKINKFLLGFVIAAGSIFILVGIQYLIKFVYNQIALYKAHNYKNIFTFLVSNRNLQVNTIKNAFAGGRYGVWGQYVGYGYTNVINCIKGNNRGSSLEMDFYGLYYYMGIIPLITWVIIWGKSLHKALKNYLKNKSLNNCILMFGIVIIMCHSIFAGHVIFESLTITYASALIAISKIDKLELPGGKHASSVMVKQNELI